MDISTNGGVSFPAPFNFSHNTGTSLSPSLTVDSSGIVYIAWMDTVSGNYDTLFSKSTDFGATFTKPLNFSPSPQGSLFTTIAVDNSQNLYVAWDDNRFPNSDTAVGNEGNFEILVSRGRTDLPAALSAAAGTCPISPNGDGEDDTSTFSASFNQTVKWELDISDSTGTVINRQSGLDNSSTYVWDGTENLFGNIVAPDGTYDYKVTGTATGSGLAVLPATGSLIVNTVDAATPPVIQLDSTGASTFVREAFAFSPNSDGFKDTDGISADFNKPVNWTLTIKTTDSGASLVRTLTGSGLSIDPAVTLWDGKDETGTVQPEGTYEVDLSAQDALGNTVSCGPLPIPCLNMEIDLTPPQLDSLGLSATSFDPSNGEQLTVTGTPTETSLVTIYIYTDTGTLVREVDRSYHDAGVAFNVVWDGKDSAGNIVQPGNYVVYAWNRDRAGNVALTYPYRLAFSVVNP